jgi:HEAT repeat protein
LISQPDRHLSFVHPVIAGYLAGTSLAFSGQTETILSQENWPLKYTTIHYLAAQNDLSAEVVNLLTDTEDPINSGVLIVGRWLRDIPFDADWRKTILQHLANMLQQEPLPMGFRARVLACLVSSNDPGVATMLRHLLKSPKNSVCHLAALGCGFFRDTQAAAELSKMSADTSLFGQAACLALVNIGTKPALEAAASIFLHGEESLRRVVSEAFAHQPTDGHPILKEASTMDDLLVRRTSIHGLRLVNEPWAIEILDEMQIEDGQWVVRNAAAQAMEEINTLDPYIPQPLVPLENLPWLIEFAGERGMGVSSGEQAQEMMLRALREGSPDQTLAALDYYRLTGDDSIFPAIYHLLYGNDPDIVEAAYHTLWQLKATGATIPSPIQFGLGY